MNRKFAEFNLYRYTGSQENAPEGFKESPSLVRYLNHIESQGYTVFQVVTPSDSMWYTIICTDEVS
jgi:hypothetical protein